MAVRTYAPPPVWTREQIVWLAGLLEGEGTFTPQTTRRNGMVYSSPRIGLWMVDRDVVECAAAILGRPVRPRLARRPAHHSDQWEVRIAGRAAVPFLYAIYPFMGERRRARIAGALAAWRKGPVPA